MQTQCSQCDEIFPNTLTQQGHTRATPIGSNIQTHESLGVIQVETTTKHESDLVYFLNSKE